MDERYAANLEAQLRDAHAANHDLRERLGEIEKEVASARSLAAQGRASLQQLEKASAKQKAAENVSATATRKREEAERDALRARAELEELRERFEVVQAEAAAHSDLSARIAGAKSAADLFPT